MLEQILAFDLGGSHVSAALLSEGLHAIVTNPIAEGSDIEETMRVIERSGRFAVAASNLEASSISGIAMAAPGLSTTLVE